MIKKSKVKGSDQVKVTFILPGDHGHGASSVVGDFNNWDPAANKFAKRNNNTYTASVNLEAGKRHVFRYYSQDGTWFNEPDADAYERNEHGAQNCIIQT